MSTEEFSDDTNRAKKPRICTYSGVEMWPFSPKPEMVRVEDIAHALSNMPRFSGHTVRFYSVAEHCCRVAALVFQNGGNNADALYGLLHDAAEAYLLDIPAPLKGMFPGYKEAEKALLACILSAVTPLPPLPGLLPEVVEHADKAMLQPERRDLLPHTDWWIGGPLPSYDEYPRIKPWSHARAKSTFLETYYDLMEAIDP
jgi:hypothetical protein